MTFLTRMILVATLAVFTAASVVHAAGSTAMAVEMSVVYATDMGIADCEACGEEGAGATACDFVCSAGSFAAVPVSEGAEIMPTLRDLRQRAAEVLLSGFATLPLRHPPRFIL